MPMLEEAIVNLLLRHNCVIVPAFGGFVAQSSGALIDMDSGVITPPRKSVLFNKQLVNNDGLLISHISSEYKIEYASSENFLKTKVDEWHAQLKEGKRVSIDKIGHLFLDAERNISFEQDRFFNLLLQSYGLNKVHFISEEDVKMTESSVIAPIERKETPIVPIIPAVETEEKKKEPTKVVALTPPADKRKAWKYIAAAVLLPIAFYTYWIPLETTVLKSGMISFKDFNPTYESGAGAYEQNSFSFSATEYEQKASLKDQLAKLPEGEVDFFNLDGKMIPLAAEKVEKETIIEVKAIPEPIVEKEVVKPVAPIQKLEQPKAVAKQIHYITGCFSDKANAERMVKTLGERGLNGVILDKKNGLYRVSAGGAESEAEFDKMSRKVQAAGYKGWKLD